MVIFHSYVKLPKGKENHPAMEVYTSLDQEAKERHRLTQAALHGAVSLGIHRAGGLVPLNKIIEYFVPFCMVIIVYINIILLLLCIYILYNYIYFYNCIIIYIYILYLLYLKMLHIKCYLLSSYIYDYIRVYIYILYL